jgi:hypothetical protein
MAKDNVGAVGSAQHGRPTQDVGKTKGNRPSTGAPSTTAPAGDNVDLSPTASQPAREYKNHGQMVSAAAHQGIHGRDLARIAKGEATIDEVLAEREAGEGEENTPVEQQPVQPIAVGEPNPSAPTEPAGEEPPAEEDPAAEEPAQQQSAAELAFQALKLQDQQFGQAAAQFFNTNATHFKNIGIT